jgi:hypothetical protein
MKLVQFQQKNSGLSPFGRMVGLAAVLLVVTLAWLTVSPGAHEFFHHDSDHADHQCVVTTFAAGEGLYLVPQIEMRPASIVLQMVHIEIGGARRGSFACLLPPVCGPPLAA